MKPDYIIQYPYSWQIGFLLVINIVLIVMYKDRIDWYKYRNVMTVLVIWGIVQINALENYTNVPAWIFPEGSSYWGVAFGHLYWDDIFFVFVCSSLFYYFVYLTRNIKDIIPKRYYVWLIGMFVIMEIQLYHYCGDGAKDLILYYTFIPLIIFSFYCVVKGVKPNVTQGIVVLVLIAAISVPWDLLAATFKWWLYDPNCNAFVKREFFFNGMIPLGISPQYTISGTVIVLFSTFVFGGKKLGISR